NASVAHYYGDLMQDFGQGGPEFPVVLPAAHAGARVALYSMVQEGECQRAAIERDRRMEGHKIPVAFFGIALHGYAADVALGICGATFAGHRGEPGEHGGLFADFGKNPGTRVLGDVMGYRKGAISPCTLGVHTTLGDDFTV